MALPLLGRRASAVAVREGGLLVWPRGRIAGMEADVRAEGVRELHMAVGAGEYELEVSEWAVS